MSCPAAMMRDTREHLTQLMDRAGLVSFYMVHFETVDANLHAKAGLSSEEIAKELRRAIKRQQGPIRTRQQKETRASAPAAKASLFFHRVIDLIVQ